MALHCKVVPNREASQRTLTWLPKVLALILPERPLVGAVACAQTGLRHSRLHFRLLLWPKSSLKFKDWGKCQSACPAVPIQEIYLMQFSSQTPLAFYQAKTGSLPHSKSSRQAAGTRAGEEDLHPQADHTAYTSGRSYRSAVGTASSSWCVSWAAPGLPFMHVLLLSYAGTMRR